MKDRQIGVVGGATLVALILGLVFLQGQCAPGPDKATATLRTMGFTDVKVTDSHPYAPTLNGCGKEDAVAHEATATNAQGQRVAVVVCCGLWMKGCTVRTH